MFVKKKFNTIQTSKTQPMYHGVVNGPYYPASEVANGLPKPAFLKPNLHEHTLVDGTSDLWTQSSSNTDEYYYTGSDLTSEPSEVKIDGSYASKGSAGSLDENEWDWADKDDLGENTLYVRLADDANPDDQDEGHIEAQTGSDKVTVSPGDTRLDLVFPLGKNADDEFVFSKKYIMADVDVTVSNSGYIYAYLDSDDKVKFDTTDDVNFTYSRSKPSSPGDGDIWFDIVNNTYKQYNDAESSWESKDRVVLGKVGVGSNGYVYSVKSYFPNKAIADFEASKYNNEENPWQFYDGVSFKTDGEFCAQQADQWVDDETICEAVFNNTIATEAVAKSHTARVAVSESTTAQNVIKNLLSKTAEKSKHNFNLYGLYGPAADSSDSVTGDFIYDEDRDVGFYGVTSADDLINGSDLASEIGLSAGTAFNDNAGWLKFFVGKNAADPISTRHQTVSAKNRVVFVAKKTLRNDLSWEDIYDAGAVYGTDGAGTANSGSDTTQDAQVAVGDIDYIVRLMTGCESDPESGDDRECSNDQGDGSEWNDLFYRVHEDKPDCSDTTIGMPGGSEDSRHGGPQDGDNWANFSNTDLQVYSNDAGDGCNTWCQEQGNDTGDRVRRGNYGVADFWTDSSDYTASNFGWRPCLEIVQP